MVLRPLSAGFGVRLQRRGQGRQGEYFIVVSTLMTVIRMAHIDNNIGRFKVGRELNTKTLPGRNRMLKQVALTSSATGLTSQWLFVMA